MRVEIDNLVAAKVLFEADRTCCVCRTRGTPVQLHHIDGNHARSTEENLAVLCVHCHDLTMIKGGFGRKLDAAQVTLYKADWIQVVARDRADRRAKNAEETNASRAEIGSAIDELEELKQKNDLLGIVFLLDEFGNTKLRDEYIEELIAQESSDVGSQIYLRHMQGRLDLLDMQEVESYLTSARSSKAWTSLGRALVKLGRKSEATEFYLRYISEALKDGNTFSAAYYLKEAFENSLDTALFEKAYAESREKGDVWWELRSLQELELDDEVGALLRREGVDTPEGLLSKDEEPKEDD